MVGRMTPDARHARRRVVAVWSTVAMLEAAIWWMFYRSNYYRPLWRAPALLLLVAGGVATVVAVRVRRGDRRAGDRRGESVKDGAHDSMETSALPRD
jgi:hypothetical protein